MNKVVVGPLGTDPTGADRHRFVLLRFTNNFVETQEEYFVFGSLTLITSCGGAMGMFVGWSCLHLREPIAALLEAADGSRRKKNEKEEDNDGTKS